MTFNDVKNILKNQDMRFSYEVDDQENIIAVYVEESGITAKDKADRLCQLMPDFHVHNFSNLNYIMITKLKTNEDKNHKESPQS